MVWCRPGDKPLSEPMMVSLLTRICVTRPQTVNVGGGWGLFLGGGHPRPLIFPILPPPGMSE